MLICNGLCTLDVVNDKYASTMFRLQKIVDDPEMSPFNVKFNTKINKFT